MSFKKPLTLLILSLSLFSFSNCGSTKGDGESITFQENAPFTIENTTSQKTLAGTKEGGTSLRLTVPVSQVKEGVVFKDLYFRAQVVEATYNPVVKSQYLGFFTNGKKDFLMDSDPKQEAKNTPRKPFPFDLKEDEAVFSYTYQDKLCYYKITTIKKLPTMALPSQNPNGLNKL